MVNTKVELLNPVASVSVKSRTLAERLDSLAGKTVGIVLPYVEWRSFDLIIERLKKLLLEEHGVSGFVTTKSAAASGTGYADANRVKIESELFDQFARKVNCSIVGAGF